VLVWLTLLLTLALPVAGCGTQVATSTSTGQVALRTAVAGDAVDLKGVCPAKIVVQSSWFPQVEHGAVYQLLGRGYRVDAGLKRVTGELVASGVDTGVRLEIRAGGPAIGFSQPSAQLYVDKSITLGMLNTDEMVLQSAAHPVLGVVAPLDLDPQVILWSPAAHPDWNGITDIGQTDVTVFYHQGSAPFMDYLTGAGILRASQLNGAYDGGPSAFIASNGQVAVQGYATNEPYAWAHEVRQWGKPVAYQLVNEKGYPNYANTLGIRPADKTRLGPCLKRLVPIIQAAQVQFLTNPEPTIKVIVEANTAYKGVAYDQPLADYAMATMRKLGIVGNGADHTLGNFDPDRIGHLINILTPIAAGQKHPVKAGLTIDDVITNEYIDPAIALPLPR
jgi:hypothetical protein